jgi:glycosyltransferase involved in cell wall biosynthesis
MDTEYPLVSAILLAGQTPFSAIKATIACFQAQTYPYKELIIVNNAPTHFKAVSLNLTAERDIFLIDTPMELSAGMARNYGIAAANGQILAQFDSDFWHAPTRLESQIATLATNEAQVVVLATTLSHSFISGRSSYHTNPKNAILNTMVFLRPTQIDYPNVEKHEELGLLNKLQHIGYSTISMPVPDLACKLYHSSTSSKPYNDGVSSEQFKLIKKIVKSHRVS